MKNEIREQMCVMGCNETQIFGVLHRPLNSCHSIVIICHGFASNKIGLGRSYVQLAEKMVGYGIATFRFDFRGCGDSEGSLDEMLVDDFVLDVFSVQDALKRKGFEKFGLFGSSFGGAIAILAAEQRKESFHSLALWAPLASGMLWAQDFMHNKPESIALKSYKGVHISKGFQKAFSELHAEKSLEKLHDLPLMHLQGEKDEVISIKHQEAFKMAREKAHAKSVFVIYPEAKHRLGSSQDLKEVLERLTLWFKETL